MSIVGSYFIDFSDPRKARLVIEPFTTNGPVNPNLHAAPIDSATPRSSLRLTGRHVADYGEIVNESLVKLLEHFASPVPPTYPTEGQLWFKTGTSYRSIAYTIDSVVLPIEAEHFAATKLNDYVDLWVNPSSTTSNTVEKLVRYVTTVNKTATTCEIKVTPSLPPYVKECVLIDDTVTGEHSMRVYGSTGWEPLTKIEVTATPPQHSVGALWYDVTEGQLKIGTNSPVGSWTSVTKDYLPLAGGRMNGTIEMGMNPVLYDGPINRPNELIPRWYADQAVNQTESQLRAEMTAAALVTSTAISNVSNELTTKVSKSGDIMYGPLSFGSGTTYPMPSGGINLNFRPMINLRDVWSSTDYLAPTTEVASAVSRDYVAKALQQHLLDETHRAGSSFIVEQSDGRGLIPNSIYYQSNGHSLSWVMGVSSHVIGAVNDTLTIETTKTSAGRLVLSHGSNVNVGPNVVVTANDTTLNQKTYLLDGQPQPTYHGNWTDKNDDTLIATKGFVRDYVYDSSTIIQLINNAIDTHVTEIVHTIGGFIRAMPDGSGMIPGPVYFEAADDLSWAIGGRSTSVGVSNTTGNLTIKFPQMIDFVSVRDQIDPGTGNLVQVERELIVVADDLTVHESVFVLDGQPQPTFLGGANDKNDDTKAATKGFVRDATANAVSLIPAIESMEFTDMTVKLQTTNGMEFSAGINHTHNLLDVSVQPGQIMVDDQTIAYLSNVNIDPSEDTTHIGQMFNAVISTKAPKANPVLTNPKTSAAEASITEVALNVLTVSGHLNVPVGVAVAVVNTTTNKFEQVSVVSAIQGTTTRPDPADPSDTITVNITTVTIRDELTLLVDPTDELVLVWTYSTALEFDNLVDVLSISSLVSNPKGMVRVGSTVAPLTKQDVLLVSNDAEAAVSKGTTVLFSDVFRSFTPISHQTTTQPSIPSELSGWMYDPVTDRIRSTINSTSTIGLISPDAYEEFVFDVTMTSSNADDDWIGVAIAATEHDGLLHLLRLDVNVGTNTGANAVLAVKAGPSVPGQDITLGSYDFGDLRPTLGTNGWAGIPNGIRFRVTRNKNNIHITASNFNDPSNLNPAISFNISLTDPRLLHYRGAQRYGYIATSQAAASWAVAIAPGQGRPVYEPAARRLWLYDYDTGTWTSSTKQFNEVLDAGRLYFNPLTKVTYWANEFGAPIKLTNHDTHWVSLTLAAGWTSGETPLEVRLRNGLVEIRGSMSPTTAATGALVTTLPPQFRPTAKYTIQNGGAASVAQDIVIATNGEIKIEWGGTLTTAWIHCTYFVD